MVIYLIGVYLRASPPARKNVVVSFHHNTAFEIQVVRTSVMKC